MTTIAWDGKTLAADKRGTTNGVVNVTTKIHRLLNGDLCGLSGDTAGNMEKLAWLAAGSVAKDYPASQRDRSLFSDAMVIRAKDMVIFIHEDTPYPYIVEDAQWAIGSGSSFARAGMRLGMSAAEAIAFAATFDCHTGNGCDTLTLGEGA